jgi:hypothetical protein
MVAHFLYSEKRGSRWSAPTHPPTHHPKSETLQCSAVVLSTLEVHECSACASAKTEMRPRTGASTSRVSVPLGGPGSDARADEEVMGVLLERELADVNTPWADPAARTLGARHTTGTHTDTHTRAHMVTHSHIHTQAHTHAHRHTRRHTRRHTQAHTQAHSHG